MRVIPPPRPRPRAPLRSRSRQGRPPLPAAARAIVTGGRLRARALRGAPEQHPLQNRQVSPEILQLGRLPRVLRPKPGVLLPKPGILLAQLSGQQRHLPVRFQRRSQHIPERCLSTLQDRDNPRRDRHAAQQTPSTTANHAPRATCPDPADTIAELLHHATSEYLRRRGMAMTVGGLAAWSSSPPSELRITSVFSCVARRLDARANFMFAGGRWWRSLAIDGSSGTSRGHAPVMRRQQGRQKRGAAEPIDAGSGVAKPPGVRQRRRRYSVGDSDEATSYFVHSGGPVSAPPCISSTTLATSGSAS